MKTNHLLTGLLFLGALLLASCGSKAKVGALRSESQSVELDGAESINVEIDFGAGDLTVTGNADKLLEADFTYNVAELKPKVEYTDGALVVRQPDTKSLSDLHNIADFRNEWDLSLHNGTPLYLKVIMGGGFADLQLAGLQLTGLDISLGAGEATLDLNGDWARDLNISIDTGAAAVTVHLPEDVGIRVEVDRGPTVVDASGLTQVGDVYTNAAYGVSEVTLHISIDAGFGVIRLDVEK